MSETEQTPEELREQSVSEFAAELAAEVEEPQDEVEEQAEIPADESEDSPVDDGGPTAEMIAVAKLYGVPETVARAAKDNAALQQIMEYVSSIAASPAPEPPQADAEEPELRFEIGEDDYDETDPVHRQLRSTVEILNKKLAEIKKTEALLVQHANAQLQERQDREAMTIQQPFDEGLDELNSGAFGNTAKGLTDAQVKLRSQAFNVYRTFIEGEPADRRKQMAQAVVRAKFDKMVPKQPVAPQAVKAAQRQARQRMGVNSSKQDVEKLSAYDAFLKRLTVNNVK